MLRNTASNTLYSIRRRHLNLSRVVMIRLGGEHEADSRLKSLLAIFDLQRVLNIAHSSSQRHALARFCSTQRKRRKRLTPALDLFSRISRACVKAMHSLQTPYRVRSRGMICHASPHATHLFAYSCCSIADRQCTTAASTNDGRQEPWQDLEILSVIRFAACKALCAFSETILLSICLDIYLQEFPVPERPHSSSR